MNTLEYYLEHNRKEQTGLGRPTKINELINTFLSQYLKVGDTVQYRIFDETTRLLISNQYGTITKIQDVHFWIGTNKFRFDRANPIRIQDLQKFENSM